MLGSMWAGILSYSVVKLFLKYSNLCDHGTWTPQTDRQTDGQTTYCGITAQHRAVISLWHACVCLYVCCRYQLFLQLKLDVLSGRLPCSNEVAAELSALALQCMQSQSYCSGGARRLNICHFRLFAIPNYYHCTEYWVWTWKLRHNVSWW